MSKFKLPMVDFVELNEKESNTFKSQDITNMDIEGDTGYYIYCDIKPIKPEIIEKTRFISSFDVPYEYSGTSHIKLQ